MALPPDSPLFPEATPEERLWPRYFLEDRFNSDDVRMPFILALAEHFAGPRKTSIRSQIERSGVFYLDLVGFDEEAPVENFTDLLRSEPTNVISCLELAIHLMLLRDGLEVQAKVIIRLLNFGPCQQLQKLIRSSNVEKFVSLQGTVVRMSSIQPLVVAMRFVCSACDSDAEITFPDGKYEPPCGCVNSSCKSRNMQPDRSSAVTIDYQKIRLQELFSDIGAETGRVPRSIEIELKQDLVDSCLPGDVITVSGIVKALKAEQRSSGSRQETCLYILYVVANSVVNTKRGTSSAEPKEGFAENGLKDSESVSNSSSSFTLQELHAIRTIHASPYLFELIVNSLCPGIFGHELVKAGLCLGLFSGGDWSTGDPNRNSMRRDIHVLLLGDPGMGKSQLLRACSVVSPRAVYVCGNSTTTAGLTVAIVKDSNGDSALEAGALVLADKGICCIDEFDKMSSDPQALLEAMEQQSISIAKAGICCSLSARASVFVAANPVGGHYNRTKTILENMKISPALLSRFDLVFVLVDDPDACRDELLSEHVLALHSNSGLGTQRSSSSQSSKFATPRRASVLGHVPTQVQSEDANLASRIKYVARSCSSFEPIPPPLLRKYIAYSKEFVRPKLSKDAKIVLKSFYLSLRRQHNSPDNCSITIRQLESLVRLSEARARMELRELVTEQDALDTVDVMKSSLFDLFSDDFQPVDPEADAKPYGPKRVDAFIKALKRAAREMEREPPLFNHKELISIAKASNVVVPNYDLFIQQMNQNNFILCKGGGMYQIL